MSTQENDNPFDRKRPFLFWSVCIIVWVGVAVALFPLLTSMYADYTKGVASPVWKQSVAGGLLLYVILSFRLIKTQETAAAFLLFIPTLNMDPGPKLIPWLLFTISTYPRVVKQKQWPGNPEEVFKGDDKEELPPGMVRPLRLVTGKPQGEDELDPYNIQMAFTILYYARYFVFDAILFTKKFGSENAFLDQIRDTADKILAREVSSYAGVTELITKLSGDAENPGLMEKLHEVLEHVTNDGGVTIVESGLNSPDLSHDLATAVRDIGVRRAKAQGTRTEIEQQGIADAFAAAQLIEQTNIALKKAGPAASTAYVGEKVLSGANTTVLGIEGLAQLFGIGGLIGKNLQKPKDEEKGDTT